MRHPACVIVCDIMCDSSRPPARRNPTQQIGCFATNECRGGSPPPTLCVLPLSKPRPGCLPAAEPALAPHGTVQPWREKRRGWCLPADHFLPEALGVPVSLEERPRLGRSEKEGMPQEKRVSYYCL